MSEQTWSQERDAKRRRNQVDDEEFTAEFNREMARYKRRRRWIIGTILVAVVVALAFITDDEDRTPGVPSGYTPPLMFTNAWQESSTSFRSGLCSDMNSGDGIRRDAATIRWAEYVQRDRGLASAPDYNVSRTFVISRC